MELLLLTMLGWLVGVLINRIADALPRGRRFLDPPRCPFCDTPRPLPDQIGTISFLLFRGRCPNCRAPISLRAPLVELATAAVFALLWTHYGATIHLLLALVYTSIFILVLVIDYEHRLILNVVILPATLLAIVVSRWSAIGMPRALLGGAIAYVVVILIYLFGKVFERVRGLRIRGGAFGQGDVKLAGFMGLVTGFPAVFQALALTILLGGAGAILYVMYSLVYRQRSGLGAAIPYGPFFCIAGWFVMVFGT